VNRLGQLLQREIHPAPESGIRIGGCLAGGQVVIDRYVAPGSIGVSVGRD
jgi:hypothetical protein